MKHTLKATIAELGCFNPSEGTLFSLPALPAKAEKSFAWARKSKTINPKPSLPVVEVKKAVKLLASVGKAVLAIEALPHGGFRVIASAEVVQPTLKHAPNAWDDVLDD
ncbi:hypothetical protein [Tabrizicola sp.]|uniref:hypothetical protein n=1 Tax=Tabrizicola sp. TaxID=2005166 RepID=UPI001A481981|nr:hypothetical protein [Tabrizicola sp.]MBL9062589.1 hypothetical protein [Tabrizicola sp.]